jgi:hypothetical protein
MSKVLVVQRALNNLVSNADMIIDAYEASFAELKIEFIMGAAVQMNLTMVRILEKVENIGKFLTLTGPGYYQ